MCVCLSETSRCSFDPTHTWVVGNKQIKNTATIFFVARNWTVFKVDFRTNLAVWWCKNIKIAQFLENKWSHFLLLQTNTVASPSKSPCLFLADGDGYQDHLLPVCEDAACQRSAIYLAKSGSKEVHNAHTDSCVGSYSEGYFILYIRHSLSLTLLLCSAFSSYLSHTICYPDSFSIAPLHSLHVY